MIRIQHLLAVIFFLACGFSIVRIQAQNLDFVRKVDISNGLAHNGVTSIIRDSEGFIWIATYDGLHRYDGYRCRIFKNTPKHSLFVNNRIRCLAEDMHGNLWLGTDEGISVFNPRTERAQTIYSNSILKKGLNGPVVRKILVADSLVICATEDDGILIFSSDYRFQAQYLPNNLETKRQLQFFDGIRIDKNDYVFATTEGLVYFNSRTGHFERPLKNDRPVMKSLTRLSQNRILANSDRGIAVYRYTNRNGKFTVIPLVKRLVEEQFNVVAVDSLNRLWLGTQNTGILFIADTESFIEGKNVHMERFSTDLGFMRASCFLITEDHCWAGSFNKGVFQFNLQKNPFRYYNTNNAGKYGMRSNEVLHVIPWRDGKVFIGTNGGGICLFNYVSGKFEPLPFELSEDRILNTQPILVDRDGDLWIKQAGRIAIVPFSKNMNRPVGLSGERIDAIKNLGVRIAVQDDEGNVWLGCMEGLVRLKIEKGKYRVTAVFLNETEQFLNNPIRLVRYVYLDPMYPYLWVGTGASGLLQIYLEKGKDLTELKVKHYMKDNANPASLSSNFVTSIVRLPNSDLWVSTERGGINKVIVTGDSLSFKAYTEEEGLSNNVVKRIVYDKDFNLWIPTNKGLNLFNPKIERFTTLGKPDGLPFIDFSYAAIGLKNGEFLFAGPDGFFCFNPDEILPAQSLPKIAFGNLTVFNKIIHPGDSLYGRMVLPQRLQNGGRLVLKHNENVFSIELLSLHYSTPDNHLVRYRLLPLSDKWIEISSLQNTISYSGLQSGEYVLEAMASNSRGEWTDPISLHIEIIPPFWVTWPAFVLYALLVGGILYSIMYYLMYLNRLRHRLEIEQMEKNKVQEVNAAKLRFFSNISHEIKTPLALISGPVSMLVERFKQNEDVRSKLEIIQRQSQKMLRLVNQVHDFQRAEANLLEMNMTHFSFPAFLKEVLIDFEFKAQSEGKRLQCMGPDEIYILADKDKLEKVLNNLLTNAFKYTASGDTITVEYSVEGRKLRFSVSDTGKGIEAEDLPHVFERFYQSKKKTNTYLGGAGIGLAFAKRLVEMHYGSIQVASEVGQGTTFTVSLPVISSKPAAENVEVAEETILELERKSKVDQALVGEPNWSKLKVAEEVRGEKIFWVEDNPDMRTFVSEVLSRFFEVRSFAHGNECLKAMETEWPSLVVSDVLMPEVNGFELCKRIKSEIKTSHIPVVLLTACTSIEDQLQGLEVGADAYIHKPFHVEHLIARIENLLLNRRVLRERFRNDIPLTLENSQDNGKDVAFLEKLYDLIEKNLDNQDLNLDTIARELYLNRTHFYQKVKTLTGHTPFELLKLYRLKKAAGFLASREYSVNEVYLMTGFKSRTHFSKLFKERYGVSPGKYASWLEEQKQ